jgi:LuxR family maltose regulon positive regulatory protein
VIQANATDARRPDRDSIAQPHSDLLEHLTLREQEILQLLDARLSNKEIGAALFITSETVKKHTSNIYQKLMVGSRREAVARGRALGLLTAPAPTRSSVHEGRCA